MSLDKIKAGLWDMQNPSPAPAIVSTWGKRRELLTQLGHVDTLSLRDWNLLGTVRRAEILSELELQLDKKRNEELKARYVETHGEVW
jgi:hypothetical protein